MTEEERTTFLRNYYSDPECPRWFMAENELLFSYRPADFPDGSDDAKERTSGILLSELGDSLVNLR